MLMANPTCAPAATVPAKLAAHTAQSRFEICRNTLWLKRLEPAVFDSLVM